MTFVIQSNHYEIRYTSYWKKQQKLDRTRRKMSEICFLSPWTFAPRLSPDHAQKPQVWRGLLRQSGAKKSKINIPWPKSNQSWRWSGYISMPNIRQLLPCILQTMSGKSQIWSVSLNQCGAKTRKINRLYQNLYRFEGNQDTSAFTGHYSHMFSRKYTETANLTSFTESKWRKKEKSTEVTEI